MNPFFQAILVIAAVLGIYGCDVSSYTNQDASVQADGGGNDGNGKDTQTGGWGDIKLHPTEGYVAVEVATPDGKPADFYVCLGGCGDANTLPVVNEFTVLEKNIVKLEYFTKAPIEGNGIKLDVRIVRPNHLFVGWNFSAKGHPDKNESNLYTHKWEEIGSWGLAPNGIYKSSHNGKNESVSTSVKDGKVMLKYGIVYAIVTHDEISPDNPDSFFQVSGKILPDLSEIQATFDAPLEPKKKFETTLTIVN